MEVNKQVNNKSIVCPRCKQNLISSNQVCINCGYDLSKENKAEEETLSFGIDTETTIIKINKNDKEISDDIRNRLSDCAKSITDIDYEMEDIHNEVFGHHKI